MVAISAQIDSGWLGSSMTFVVTRAGTQLGTASATVTSLASGLVKATATIDMSGYGAGFVDLSLIENSTNALAWIDTIQIDAAGNLSVISNESLNAIRSKTDLITAGRVYVISRIDGTNINLFVAETQSVTFTTPDYTARTLEVVFEYKNLNDISVITDGSITKTTDSISFAIPSAVTAVKQDVLYSIRDTSTNEVLIQGWALVDYAAKQ